ncbi:MULTISPECIES: hypothetical protein [unclassified Streptococcus]|uniref:hypothetical protein n=1 Tax=unclassified Streptococcus TaxID=2608887 RepID=UPI00211B5917|nr:MULTISPECIES: hypothetical protein [unclassified Streptococcus]MCQ9211659.1 hypothetical protein [Streptococcus sp. B01]MCQ9213176.1 hypothetical protein [Streptococcus sp. O1]MCQ9215051.1 hypothetical protein [Streptococcus sp. O1]
MERTVTIDEKDWRLGYNAYTPIAYKAEFGKDYFQEIIAMFKNHGQLQDILMMAESDTFEEKQISIDMLTDFDMTFFHRLFYIFAKSANPKIGTFEEVFSSMETFPLDVVAKPLMDMLKEGMQTKKKSITAQMQAMKSLQ